MEIDRRRKGEAYREEEKETYREEECKGGEGERRGGRRERVERTVEEGKGERWR